MTVCTVWTVHMVPCIEAGTIAQLFPFIPYFVGCKLCWEHCWSISLVLSGFSVCRYRICCFLCSVWWQALIILTRQHVALCFRRPHSLQFLCGWTFVFIAGRPLWCDEILLKRSVISVSVKDAHTSEVTRVRISSPLNKTNPFTIWTSLWLQQMATSKHDIFFLHTCLILSKQTWWKSDLHRYRPLCGCVCVCVNPGFSWPALWANSLLCSLKV